MGLFSDLFSTKPAEEAAAAKAAGYATGKTDANAALDAGLAQANPLYKQAYGDFSSLAGKFGAGQDTYNDATGVNGADGVARAASIFKSLPGYSGGLTTGIDAVNRGAAARGDLGGGNTAADTIKFASDYDANKYGNFLSALAPNLSGATAATSGGAGVLGAQAGTATGVAGQKASYDWNAATGTGNANADAALAPYSASQNFWSALMGGANLLGKATGIGGWAPSTTLKLG
ncbi:hypothetical protein [Afipia sp. DC4300-2b1]|uniref:hypothetical protein n=1 Tax=Afipia sp. DC4300-2b1 TaxID=2804672 RepID=UPI003CF3137A